MNNHRDINLMVHSQKFQIFYDEIFSNKDNMKDLLYNTTIYQVIRFDQENQNKFIIQVKL